MEAAHSEFIRSRGTKRVYLVLFLCFLGLSLQSRHLYQMADESQREIVGYWLQLYYQVLQNQRTVLFFAAISGMVYAQSLMEDESQRFFYLCFCRETKLEYIQGKIIANLGLTSITFLAAGFMCIMMELLIYSPREQVLANQSLLDSLGPIVSVSISYLLFNFLWGSLAMLISYGMRSIYLAYLSPFIVFYFLIIISQQFFKKAKILNPYLWIQNSQDFKRQEQWILLFILCIVINLLLAVLVYKRSENA